MKLLSILIFLFIHQISFSQEKLKWGQLSQDEINLTKVSFEPDADAVILREEAELTVTKKGYILEEHSKIKILSTNGYENAQKKWRFYTGNNYDNITFEEGHTINIVNGKQVITPVSKSDLFITDINSNTKEISVAFPNVNVGSIIEYKIKTVRAFHGYSNVWNFQNNIPTLSSVLNKKNSSYGKILLYGETLNKKYKNKKHRTKWELNNISSTKTYSLVYNPNDYRDRIALQDSYSDNDSWKRFIKIISSEIDKNSAKTNFDAIASKIPNGNNKLETLQNCIQYIQGNLTWNEVFEVIPNNLNENLLRNKSGNTADLNVLLNKILKAKNIEAELIVSSNRDNGRIIMIYPVLTGIQTMLNLVTIDQGEQILIDAANSNPKNLRYLSLDFFNIIAARINTPNKIFITNYPILSEHLSVQVLEITPKKAELKIKDNYRGYFEQRDIDNLTGSVSGNLRYENQDESLDDWKVKRRIYELENDNFFTFENRFIDLIKSISIEEDRKQPIEINFPFQHIVQIKTKKKPQEYQFDISNFNIEISAFDGQLKYIQKSEETDNDVILTWQLLIAKSFFNTNEIEEYYNFIKTTKEATQHSAILKKI